MRLFCMASFFFFFKDAAPTEISPLPLHAALPIWCATIRDLQRRASRPPHERTGLRVKLLDRDVLHGRCNQRCNLDTKRKYFSPFKPGITSQVEIGRAHV